MKRLSAGLVLFVLLLSGCSRQLPETGLEPLASWSTLGTKVVPDNDFITSLAFNALGNPIVATRVFDLGHPGSSFSVYVQQWQNGQWQRLGTHLDVQRSRNAFIADIAVDKLGRPVVVWHEYSGIYVKRWDGASWVLLGGKLDINSANISAGALPALEIDSQNRPVVVWQEHERNNFNNYNLYVKRWENDASWVQVGDTLDVDITRIVYRPSIAIDPNDRIVVAWGEAVNVQAPFTYNLYVKRWNGSRWVRLGGALDVNVARDALQPSLALSSNGKLYVAWDEVSVDASGNANARYIYIKRWDGNNTWTLLGEAVSGRGQGPSLVASGADALMVSWTSWAPGSLPPPTNIYVKRWSGTKWLAVGGQLVMAESGNSILNISPAGIPTLAYSYNPSDPNHVADKGAYIKSYQ
jgi:hypothetical protein